MNRYSYTLNNPLRMTDPSGMSPSDNAGQAVDIPQQTATPSPTPPPAQPEQKGPRIDVTPGKVQILAGEQLKFPNGEPAVGSNGRPVQGYGAAAVATITAYDENGDPIEPDSGYTMDETVVLDPDNPPKPKDAAGLAENVAQPRKVSLRPGGIVYDIQAGLVPDAKTYQEIVKQGGFSVTKLQTLTLRDEDGNMVAQRTNRITETHNNVTVVEVKPKPPK